MLYLLFFITFLFSSISYAATEVRQDGSSKGYINVLDFVSGPTVTVSGIVGTITGGGTGSGGYVVAPSSATSICTTGQYSADSSYFYICEATNTWLRTSIATWAGGGGFLVFRGSKLTFMGSGLKFLGD